MKNNEKQRKTKKNKEMKGKGRPASGGDAPKQGKQGKTKKNKEKQGKTRK